MKAKNYKKPKQKTLVAKEPSVAYNSSGLDSSASGMTPDGVASADTDTMTVDEYIGRIRKALDRRYENIQC